MERINHSVETYNTSNEMPYRLGFSIGYDVYDFNSKMTASEFKIHIDELMYKNKPYNLDKELLSTSSHI